MSPRYACYRRPGFQRLFDDSSLLFDRSPPSHFSLGCLIKDGLLGCVHLFLMDTYRCAHIGQHPYLLSLRPDGSHQSLTLNSVSVTLVLNCDLRSISTSFACG